MARVTIELPDDGSIGDFRVFVDDVQVRFLTEVRIEVVSAVLLMQAKFRLPPNGPDVPSEVEVIRQRLKEALPWAEVE